MQLRIDAWDICKNHPNNHKLYYAIIITNIHSNCLFSMIENINYLTTSVSQSSTITLMINNNHHIIILTTILIIIIRFLTLVLASIFARLSNSKLTISRRPSLQAKWRAVNPYYKNNEEIRHENKKMLMIMIILTMTKIVMMIFAKDDDVEFYNVICVS